MSTENVCMTSRYRYRPSTKKKPVKIYIATGYLWETISRLFCSYRTSRSSSWWESSWGTRTACNADARMRMGFGSWWSRERRSGYRSRLDWCGFDFACTSALCVRRSSLEFAFWVRRPMRGALARSARLRDRRACLLKVEKDEQRDHQGDQRGEITEEEDLRRFPYTLQFLWWKTKNVSLNGLEIRF